VDLETLAMTPKDFLTTILDPGLLWCATLPGWTIPPSDAARALLLAIAGQEGDWQYRIQAGNGPAHSFWQFERAGGVQGVLHNPATAGMTLAVCHAADVPPFKENVWGFMATDKGDNLSVAFARLLLWSDPAMLPEPNEASADEAWHYYLRNWRPGKPGPDRWSGIWRQVAEVIKE
jgi:hypothetical protein